MKTESRYKFYIRILFFSFTQNIGHCHVEGKIIDLDFMYPAHCAEFMTNDDIVRNTQILKDSEPFLFFEDYAEMGVRVLPRFPIPIHERCIEEYLNGE